MTFFDIARGMEKEIRLRMKDDSQWLKLRRKMVLDMIKAYEPDPVRTDMIIGNWLRLKDTIDYLGIWETLNNPGFNPIEFDGIKTQTTDGDGGLVK